MCQVNGKDEISTPHSSHIFQPILTKLETKKDIWNTTQRAKFGWCGTTGKKFYGSKRVFPRKIGPFGGLDDKKINVWRSKRLKNMILGAWINILSQICAIFESQYLEKYAFDQHKIWRGILGAQMDFVGGPALQNYNSR